MNNRWANFYRRDLSKTTCYELWPTREDADREANPGRIACKQVWFEDGEGLTQHSLAPDLPLVSEIIEECARVAEVQPWNLFQNTYRQDAINAQKLIADRIRALLPRLSALSAGVPGTVEACAQIVESAAGFEWSDVTREDMIGQIAKEVRTLTAAPPPRPAESGECQRCEGKGVIHTGGPIVLCDPCHGTGRHVADSFLAR